MNSLNKKYILISLAITIPVISTVLLYFSILYTSISCEDCNFEIKKNENAYTVSKKLVQKKDILVFVHSKKKDILKRLKKREGFNSKLIKIFKKIQLPLDYKKRKSHFVIKNDFTEKTVKKYVKNILRKIKWKK